VTIHDLDEIISASLRSFYEDISTSNWRGREREMVSLFALGHLSQHCDGPLHLNHIGIEVAVRQLPGDKRRENVCKDLVIWPERRMTCWDGDGQMQNEPLAIMEWKVNHFLNTREHDRNRRDHVADATVRPVGARLTDVQWLQATSNRLSGRDFVGYAVLVESARTQKELRSIRVCGASNEPWVRI
jgi:hypothetical protein